LSGFRDVSIEFCFLLLRWPLAYGPRPTTACTTVQLTGH